VILLHGGIHLNRSLFGFQASLGTDYWTVRCFLLETSSFFPQCFVSLFFVILCVCAFSVHTLFGMVPA